MLGLLTITVAARSTSATKVNYVIGKRLPWQTFPHFNFLFVTDAQEGECPAEAQAKKYMEQYATNDKGKDKDKPSVKGRRIAFSKMDEKMSNWSPPEHDFTACVGDFNCPGKLKCCSEDVYVYVSDRHGYLQRNRDPTNGYCMEPAGKNETKKSHHHR